MKVLEVDDVVLQNVVSSLNYPSVSSFEEDVNNIRKWMEKQPHLPEVMSPKKIQNFLILNKGSVERTKEKIDNYYTVRSQMPHIFDEINPKLPFMQKNFEAFYMVPFPKLTKDMFRVSFFKVRDSNLMEKITPIYLVRYMLNAQEVRLVEDVTFGDVIILDGKDTPLNFILRFTPNILYTIFVVLYKNVYSSRIKAVHLINIPKFAEKLLSVAKLIMGDKMTKRLHIHHNYDFLVEEFGKEIVPCDFGGEEKSMAELQRLVRQKCEEYSEMFDGLDKFRVREELRPRKVELSGNFKKLEVD